MKLLFNVWSTMSYLLITINYLISIIAIISILLIKLLFFTGPGAGKQFGMDAPGRSRNEIGPPSKQKLSLEND